MKPSWTIRFKLYIILLIVILGLIIYGLLSYQAMNKIRIGGAFYTQISNEKNLLADIIPPRGFILRNYLIAYMLLDETDPKTRQALLARAQELEKDYADFRSFWEKGDLPKEIRKEALVLAYTPAELFFHIWNKEFSPAITSNEIAVAKKILEEKLSPLFEEHRLRVLGATALIAEEYKNLEKMGHTIYSRAKTLLIITWFSTLLLGALLTYILGRSIFNELEATTLTLDKASQEIKEKILQQSETVALQSSSVHETTAAMDELNASFEHTRALAKDASNNANNSVKISDEGNLLLKKLLVNLNTHKESVNALSNQMLQLNDFTKQIHKVAVVINNLTGQTNILALNAAIQATHAKEHSEGFSVIAAEIRKLADESKKFLGQIDLLVENMTEETDEISKIVSLGNKTIHDCIKLAEDTTKNFDRVITIAHVTFESSEQVALNINQQASGVTQVLEAMELLTSGTKITAEGMKQVKDSLGKLDKTTSHLKSII